MADSSQALAPGGDDPYGYAVFGQASVLGELVHPRTFNTIRRNTR